MAIDILQKLFYYIRDYIKQHRTGNICFEVHFNDEAITAVKKVNIEKVKIM